jgi:hypothetical protein
MLISSFLIALSVVVLVLYSISVAPLGGRGKKIARAAVIVIGAVAAL